MVQLLVSLSKFQVSEIWENSMIHILCKLTRMSEQVTQCSSLEYKSPVVPTKNLCDVLDPGLEGKTDARKLISDLHCLPI